MLGVTRPTKDCLHLSEFSGKNGENMEKLLLFGSGGHVSLPHNAVFAAQQHWLLPARSTVHCGWPLHMSLLTCQLSGLYAVFALHVFTITFRVHKEENKRWRKDTEWLLSFQSALGWNSST